ncbi:DUF551 domain-containing protein [Klebsiella pneumoniae]|uniref:DUF551 domain-containing protein n=1 Tax=Klebsiella pneumoniae TaxID=573 RepID=UPI00098388A3|nr:DUF551 domain-containing protein [Klebsiella pneumoniae]AWC98587.1 DUF551 domain-containing protein [Klebsiella pneumoniae]AWD96303.1 DUF551 domain-containing protein [Klebsiella pneumoniae]AWS83478.1 DUF551 domain-containing protein [Klebsiella pneumoniae]EIW9081641.1 DUF551 domain-containing protein [Klebsiella pneumoniae]EIW9090370.1 DUF551 domain-containing protein [Klebsiella pneumoniae]
MTSKLTREERVQSLYGLKIGQVLNPSDIESIKMLARMALAAMDGEPVALQPELAKVIYHFRDWNEGFPVERFKADYVISWMLANYPPAPVVSADLLHTAASAIEDLLTTKDRTGAGVWFDLPFRLRSAANAQPAPVVPDDVSIFEAAIEECKKCDSIDEHAWNYGVLAAIAKYESCRAAMRQELKKSAGTEAICRSDENVQVLHTKSPAQSDCCPAQNQGWIPVSERMPEDRISVILWDAEIGEVTSGHYSHKTQTFYHCGDAIENEITHWMPPPCAPQEVK